MIKRITSLLIILGMFLFSLAYAAPIDLPSNLKGLEGKIWSYNDDPEQIEVSLGIETDFVSERELSDLDAKVEGNFYTTKLVFSNVKKFDFYVNIGQVQNIEYKATILGRNVKFDLKDKFTWGVGVSYELTSEDDPLQIGIDTKYREVMGMDYESVILDGTTYSKSQLGGKVDAEWQEWQVAFLIGKKFNYFIPYAGVKYSDVDTSAEATVSGTTYDLGSTDSESKVGVFVGCSIIPTEQFSIDLEGRFIDEEAFTVRATYKF